MTEEPRRPGRFELVVAAALVAFGAAARVVGGRRPPRPGRRPEPPPLPRPGPFRLLKVTIDRWTDDRGPKMAAALAYYTAFAVAPLLLIAIAVAGLLFGQEAARGEVARQLAGLLGQQGAEAVQDMLQRVWRPRASLVAAGLGVLTTMIAATGVFMELQDSLDQVWKVRKKPGRGLLGTLRDRFFSFSIVIATGFLLLVSLVASAALQALSSSLSGWGGSGGMIEVLNFILSFAVTAALFAVMFRFLPDARTPWHVVWIGGLVTAFLFTVGKTLIGLYLGRGAVASTYGAAGSFVIFLLWVNYSAQIVFLGAELTKAYADLSGAKPRLIRGAESTDCLEVKREIPREPELAGRSTIRRTVDERPYNPD